MANLIIREKSIVVRFTRFETLRALQKSFEIPLDKVRGATCDNEYIQSGLGLRSPGTGFPGYIAEGTFSKEWSENTLTLEKRTTSGCHRIRGFEVGSYFARLY